MIPTFSPQGDGNRCNLIIIGQRNIKALIPTFSPQGDGNGNSTSSNVMVVPSLIPTFSPQGDGNVTGMKNWTTMYPLLIPTFSPQGDGNVSWTSQYNRYSLKVDPYLFPARGRKPVGHLS